MKKILVCGVANSGNLGDRIIAESVNHLIHSSHSDYKVCNFDFTTGKVVDFENNNINLNSSSVIKKIIPDFMRSYKVKKKYKTNINLKFLLFLLSKYIYIIKLFVLVRI